MLKREDWIMIQEKRTKGVYIKDIAGGCQVFCVTGFKPAPDRRTESRTG